MISARRSARTTSTTAAITCRLASQNPTGTGRSDVRSWTDKGLRDKVGASHLPLPALLGPFVDAGFVLDRFTEGGAPIPTVLAVRALKPA